MVVMEVHFNVHSQMINCSVILWDLVAWIYFNFGSLTLPLG